MAALTRAAYFSGDLDAEPLPGGDLEAGPAGMRLHELARRPGRRSALAVPLISKDIVLGAICVFWPQARRRDEQLQHVPELEVHGLSDRDARALLSSAVRFQLDERILDRIIASFIEHTVDPCFSDPAVKPMDQIRCFLDRVVATQRAGNCVGGCPLGNLASFGVGGRPGRSKPTPFDGPINAGNSQAGARMPTHSARVPVRSEIA